MAPGSSSKRRGRGEAENIGRFYLKKGFERIVFPLDCSTFEEAREYIGILKDNVGLFKVGLELFVSDGPRVLDYLNAVAPGKIFLDLKFHDIPATVLRAQVVADRYKVSFTTVHCSDGVKHLAAGLMGVKNRVLGVTVLTSLSNLDLEEAGGGSEDPADCGSLVFKRAQTAKKAGCSGVVCSGEEVEKIKKAFGKEFVVVTPGIRPEWAYVAGDDQVRSVTPYEAIKKGADYIVIGRPVRDADDPVNACERVAEEVETALGVICN